MHCFLAAPAELVAVLQHGRGAAGSAPRRARRRGRGAGQNPRPRRALRRALSVVLTGEVPVLSLSPGEVVALPAEGESQRSGFLKAIYLLDSISLASRLALLYLFTSPYGTFLYNQHMNHF